VTGPASLGPRSVGLWSAHLRSRDTNRIARVATTIEELGYRAVWLPGGVGGDVFGAVETTLDATSRLTVATGVVNIWMQSAEETAARHARIRERHPGRFLLGLGASHARTVEASGQTYRRPRRTLQTYLDALDRVSDPAPASERVLAALGPRMLELAAARSRGAHPYLVTADHTQHARELLGPDAFLAPELKVVLDNDPERARRVARAHLATYLELPNYLQNLRRQGFGDDDLGGGGSDRFVDRVVAWGDVGQIFDRVQEHHAAGADHVCLQVLTVDRRRVPVDEWATLAPILQFDAARSHDPDKLRPL
jgi:probable F420-dependent oxidoreductase